MRGRPSKQKVTIADPESESLDREKTINELRAALPGGDRQAATAKHSQEGGAEGLFIFLTQREIEGVMNYLIESNAGIQIFLLLDKRIKEAGIREAGGAAEPGGSPTARNYLTAK